MNELLEVTDAGSELGAKSNEDLLRRAFFIPGPSY